MDDADAMGFGEAGAHFPGEADRLADRQGADAVDEALEVLAGHVLHGDEVGRAFAAQVVHATDVPVGDRPGQPQLAAEALDRPLVGGDLGIDQLEGELLTDFRIVDLVDAAHAALAQVLDDLVATGKRLARHEFAERRRGHGQGRRPAGFRRGGQGSAATAAETRLRGIFGSALGTAHVGSTIDRRKDNPSTGWCQRAAAAIMPTMRKWLVLLLVLAILYALPKINTRRSRRKFPLMKRIDDTVNVLAAVLLLVYLVAFGRWLWTEFLK